MAVVLHAALTRGGCAGDVVDFQMVPGVAISKDQIEQLLQQHKPVMLFMCHGVHLPLYLQVDRQTVMNTRTYDNLHTLLFASGPTRRTGCAHGHACMVRSC